MINFEKFALDNGLRVIVHTDKTTPMVAVNVLYDVGSKDEQPDKTGFAHLFEHLMFGGSMNIPVYDEPLERVGGENNAFTNSDMTNYYLTLPKQNIETAFWLESDRMLNLAFSKKSLEVQRNVVSEEFKQNYLNQPYGDFWMLLRPMVFEVHPYQWPTIGRDISHITGAEMEDVKSFYHKFYNPNNSILSIAGNIEVDEVKMLAEKWFGSIPAGETYNRVLPQEPHQKQARQETVERDVPFDVLGKAYHMASRLDSRYYAHDLITDLFSNGDSSRFTQELVKKQKLFSDIQAFVTGEIEEGLLVIYGKLHHGITFEEAEKAIEAELDKLKASLVDNDELQKVKNKVEATLTFYEMRVQERAFQLAYGELLGDASLVNHEIDKYQAVKPEDIQREANAILIPTNCSTLYYKAKNNHNEQ
ncbi:MAG: insulinase family protein [Bacteroidales bacterium]|nr:insulinase family protein [Bacteroidales bacterium]